MDYLATLKLLLGIRDSSKDELLNIVINETVSAICGYCRIDEVPTKLESYVPIMAADYYRLKGYGMEKAPEFVKSESQGKRSYSVENGFNIQSWLNDHKARLDPFRVWRGRVPTDLDEVDGDV